MYRDSYLKTLKREATKHVDRYGYGSEYGCNVRMHIRNNFEKKYDTIMFGGLKKVLIVIVEC